MATEALYQLEFGERRLVIDAAAGARVARFEFRGQNILTDSSYHDTYWGSTLWSSPESDWQHPAPAPLDRGSYRLTAQDDSMLSFASEKAAHFAGKVVLARKTFRCENATLLVEYQLENASNQVTFCVAPWEVTRVPGGGLSFYPHRELLRETGGMNIKREDGITWFDHDAVGQRGQKLWARGREGWLAHAASGLLHVKEFVNLKGDQLAPGEGDVEIYSSGNPRQGLSYVELETQGPYRELKPGASSTWTVRWHLGPIACDSPLGLGGPALLRQVRSWLQH